MELVDRIITLDPDRIILFGSLAGGNQTDDSDIDLIVVTNSDNYPKDYDENMDIYLEVSRVLDDVRNKPPIDLIVYTKPMYERFVNLGSMFSREIEKNGIVLYERNNQGMAH